MHIPLVYKYNILKGVIGEMWCDFFLIYVPTHYSAVFLLHASAPAPIKIGFGVVRCGAVLAVVSVKLTPLISGIPKI